MCITRTTEAWAQLLARYKNQETQVFEICCLNLHQTLFKHCLAMQTPAVLEVLGAGRPKWDGKVGLSLGPRAGSSDRL